MEWVKIPTKYYLDARVGLLSDGAEVMYLRGLDLAAEQRQDGFIHQALLIHLTRHWRRSGQIADQLVKAGLWEHAEDGYQVADWKNFEKPRHRQQIPLNVRLEIYERDGWICLQCGAGDALTLDHIWPWSLGGSDAPENLQTLCLPCNMRKGDRIQ